MLTRFHPSLVAVAAIVVAPAFSARARAESAGTGSRGSAAAAASMPAAPPTPPTPPTPPSPPMAPRPPAPMKTARSVPAQAGEPAVRLRGTPPTASPHVSLSADHDPVDEILAEIASQAGWSLAHTLPRAVARQRMTLEVQDSPAVPVLEAVLSMAKLTAEFNGNVLTVQATPEALREAQTDEIRASVTISDDEDEADEEDEEGEEGDSESADEESDGTEEEAEAAPAADVGDEVRATIDGGHSRRHGNKQERVVMGGSLTITPEETVDSAVVMGGELTIQGHVREDAVVMGGKMIIEPSARIDGDVVAIGGELQIADGANVRGDRVRVGGAVGGLAGLLSGAAHAKELSPAFSFAASILWVLLRAITIFVIALLLLTFAPARTRRVREFMTAKPVQSLIAGVILSLGFIPLCVLLGVTIIGLPLIPVAFVGLAALLAFGLTSFITWLGDRLPVFVGRKTQLGAMLIGIVFLMLVDLVPFVGGLVLLVIAFVSAGAALLSRLGAEPKVPLATSSGY